MTEIEERKALAVQRIMEMWREEKRERNVDHESMVRTAIFYFCLIDAVTGGAE